ncbi:hypothetical protein M427DRAFT_357097, partial [Gonapodya prolifera JEL478]
MASKVALDPDAERAMEKGTTSDAKPDDQGTTNRRRFALPISVVVALIVLVNIIVVGSVTLGIESAALSQASQNAIAESGASINELARSRQKDASKVIAMQIESYLKTSKTYLQAISDVISQGDID